LAAEETAIANWRERAEAAVQCGDDTEAIRSLQTKREREVVATTLAKQLAEVTSVAQGLRKQIELMRSRVDAAKRKLGLLAARQRAADTRQRLLRESGDFSLREDAFLKFERMCRKVERTEAEADALAELAQNPSQFPTGSDIDHRALQQELAAELRELKAKRGK
jgi:phage shock protein A